MATVARKGIVCEHCNKFLDFSYGTESATGVLCLYCRGYVEIRDDLLVTLRMETTNMADITQHTPVPWSIGTRRWITSGDLDIARIHSVSKIGEGEAVANAEFIIRACNSHDALLEALVYALADLEGIMPEYEPSGDREHPGWQTIKDIKAAIAKAKGGN